MAVHIWCEQHRYARLIKELHMKYAIILGAAFGLTVSIATLLIYPIGNAVGSILAIAFSTVGFAAFGGIIQSVE